MENKFMKIAIEEANKASNSQTSDNLTSLNKPPLVTDPIENHEITIGKYEESWDSIDKSQLKQLINEIKTSLNPQQKQVIVSSNATVREVVRSFVECLHSKHISNLILPNWNNEEYVDCSGF